MFALGAQQPMIRVKQALDHQPVTSMGTELSSFSVITPALALCSPSVLSSNNEGKKLH